MQTSSEPVIEMVDVDIPRGASTSLTPVLRDLRWAVHRAEFWVVAGAPGSGKTDLLLTAAAVQRPLKGFQLLFGKDITQVGEDELVTLHLKVGMVFSTGRLFSDLTIAENLSLPLAYHGGLEKRDKYERVDATLDLLGISHLRDSRPSQVLRSYHQQIGLARALVLDPEVLLIDDPLAGADPRQVRWWLDFLCQLHKGHPGFGGKPITIVVSADDLRPWLETANRFGIIQDQQLLHTGGREDVKKSTDPAVRNLLLPRFEI